MSMIEKLAKDLIVTYDSGSEEDARMKLRRFLREIKNNEYQFKKVVHPYLMAECLYCILAIDEENDELKDEEYYKIVKLIYYCLLKNYIENSDVSVIDAKYRDVIGGSQMVCVLLCKYRPFIINTLLTGMLNYLPNFSEIIACNMLSLFGGIVKDASDRHIHHFIDSTASEEFEKIAKDLDSCFPTSERLQSLKEKMASVIQDVVKELEYSFSISTDDFDLF